MVEEAFRIILRYNYYRSLTLLAIGSVSSHAQVCSYFSMAGAVLYSTLVPADQERTPSGPGKMFARHRCPLLRGMGMLHRWTKPEPSAFIFIINDADSIDISVVNLTDASQLGIIFSLMLHVKFR